MDTFFFSIRENFQVFNWWFYLLNTVIFMLITWRIFKNQSFIVLITILLLEAALFYSVASTPDEPFNLAPTLMIIALITLSVGIKSALSYMFILLINLALAVGVAFLLEFVRKVFFSKKVKDEAYEEYE